MNIAEKKTVLRFEISATGHQIIEAKINGKILRFILDTAAGASVLDRACLAELGIEETENNEGARGLGTLNHEMGDIKIPGIEIDGTLYEESSFISLNLDHVQVAGGEKGVQGLLGYPFFSRYKALIDFGRNEIVLTSLPSDA